VFNAALEKREGDDIRIERLPRLPLYVSLKISDRPICLNKIITRFHLATCLGNRLPLKSHFNNISPLFFSHFLPLLTSAHGGSKIFQS